MDGATFVSGGEVGDIEDSWLIDRFLSVVGTSKNFMVIGYSFLLVRCTRHVVWDGRFQS